MISLRIFSFSTHDWNSRWHVCSSNGNQVTSIGHWLTDKSYRGAHWQWLSACTATLFVWGVTSCASVAFALLSIQNATNYIMSKTDMGQLHLCQLQLNYNYIWFYQLQLQLHNYQLELQFQLFSVACKNICRIRNTIFALLPAGVHRHWHCMYCAKLNISSVNVNFTSCI